MSAVFTSICTRAVLCWISTAAINSTPVAAKTLCGTLVRIVEKMAATATAAPTPRKKPKARASIADVNADWPVSTKFASWMMTSGRQVKNVSAIAAAATRLARSSHVKRRFAVPRPAAAEPDSPCRLRCCAHWLRQLFISQPDPAIAAVTAISAITLTHRAGRSAAVCWLITANERRPAKTTAPAMPASIPMKRQELLRGFALPSPTVRVTFNTIYSNTGVSVPGNAVTNCLSTRILCCFPGEMRSEGYHLCGV